MGETPLKMATKRLHEAPPSPRVRVPDLILGGKRRFCGVSRVSRKNASPVPVTSCRHWKESSPGRQLPRLNVRSGPARCGRRWQWSSWRRLLPDMSCTARYGGASGPAGITSIAVLPFRNTSNDPGQDYVSEGISEGLINRLSQLNGLKVVANSSSSRYRGQDVDPREVARALDVAGILAGKVSQRGDSLSISVELIDGRDRSQVWGEQYARKAGDLFQVSAEISRDVAEKLHVRAAAGQPQGLEAPETRNPAAYELLLKGHSLRAKGGTEDRQKAGRVLRSGYRRRSGLRARLCRSIRHLSEPRQQRPPGPESSICPKRERRRRRRSNSTRVLPMGTTRWRIS